MNYEKKLKQMNISILTLYILIFIVTILGVIGCCNIRINNLKFQHQTDLLAKNSELEEKNKQIDKLQNQVKNQSEKIAELQHKILDKQNVITDFYFTKKWKKIKVNYVSSYGFFLVIQHNWQGSGIKGVSYLTSSKDLKKKKNPPKTGWIKAPKLENGDFIITIKDPSQQYIVFKYTNYKNIPYYGYFKIQIKE